MFFSPHNVKTHNPKKLTNRVDPNQTTLSHKDKISIEDRKKTLKRKQELKKEKLNRAVNMDLWGDVGKYIFH